MPLFHLTDDSIDPIEQTRFDTLHLRERGDLQRILRSKLDVIAPDCKLLAEEFCSWDDARRRIDLLAVDKEANLIVIELKRTDDGGHLELQALRYAAMISTMTFEQAVDAHAEHLHRMSIDDDPRRAILDFLEWEESTDDEFARRVRIVLVSGDFSKEVTTTVLWLNDQGLDVQCVRLRPYTFRGETLVDVQPLIPLPEATQYQVRIRERDEERRAVAAIASSRDRRKFDLTINGVTERRVNKRKAVLKIARALVDSGVLPEQITPHVFEGRAERFFASTDGELGSENFVRKVSEERSASGKPFAPNRWFCDDDELIHANGRTYAVSNQWGTNTELVIRRLATTFPAAGIVVDSFAE